MGNFLVKQPARDRLCSLQCPGCLQQRHLPWAAPLGAKVSTVFLSSWELSWILSLPWVRSWRRGLTRKGTDTSERFTRTATTAPGPVGTLGVTQRTRAPPSQGIPHRPVPRASSSCLFSVTFPLGLAQHLIWSSHFADGLKQFFIYIFFQVSSKRRQNDPWDCI